MAMAIYGEKYMQTSEKLLKLERNKYTTQDTWEFKAKMNHLFNGNLSRL